MRFGRRHLWHAVGVAVVLQLVLPVVVALVAGEGALALGLILMLAAPPITGSPHIAAMVGADPAPAMRQVVVGTALLPLTAVPVFWLLPAFGSPSDVVRAVLWLLATIAVAGGAALALRVTQLVRDNATDAIDAVAAVALGAVVIGIMSAVGPALHQRPGSFVLLLAAGFAANIVLQLAGFFAGRGAEAPSLGIVAGNRNIVLLLGVLPAEVGAELLLFIGCYQIPMYLTPVMFGRLYRA
jgi:hypothetical protein